MAYIGKVQVGDKWEKLVGLIRQQVPSQSSFNFTVGSTYSLQVESGTVRVCNNTGGTPDSKIDGEHLTDEQFGIYEPDSGTLFVRAKPKTGVVWLSISKLS